MKRLALSALTLTLSGCFVGAFEDPAPPTSLVELTPDTPSSSAAWLPQIVQANAVFRNLASEPQAPANTLWLSGSQLESDGSRTARVWSVTPSSTTLTSILSTQLTAGADSSVERVRAQSATRWLAAGSGKTAGIQSAALWVTTNSGSTWSLLDSYQLSGSQDTETKDFRIDASGSYLWLVQANDASGVAHSVLRLSGDQGASWLTLDDAQVEASAATLPTALFLPSASGVVVIGSAFQAGSEHAWIHQSADSGATWTDDLFQEVAGSAARWGAITLGASATDWAVCGTTTSASQTAALIRTSTNSGASWSTALTDRASTGNQDCRSLTYVASSTAFAYAGQRTSPSPFGFLKLTGTTPSFLDTLRVAGMTSSQLDQVVWEPFNAGESFSIGSFTDEWGVPTATLRRLVTP